MATTAPAGRFQSIVGSAGQGARRATQRIDGERVVKILVFGFVALLLLLGITGTEDPTDLLSLGLAGLGVLLIVQSRRQAGNRGLFILCAFLAVPLTAAWWAGAPLDTRPNLRSESPLTRQGVYELSVGQLTLDLADSSVRDFTIDATVGVGRIVVIVPEGVEAENVGHGTYRIGFGKLGVPGKDEFTIGHEEDEVINPPLERPIDVIVNARVGIGSVEFKNA